MGFSGELSAIKRNISGIISELDSIAYAMNKEYSNVGNDKCASFLYSVSGKFREVSYRLGGISAQDLEDSYRRAIEAEEAARRAREEEERKRLEAIQAAEDEKKKATTKTTTKKTTSTKKKK